jgi:hypothetical protein
VQARVEKGRGHGESALLEGGPDELSRADPIDGWRGGVHAVKSTHGR